MVFQRLSPTRSPSLSDGFNIRLHCLFWFLGGLFWFFFFSLVQHSGVRAAALRDILFLILNTVPECCGLFLNTV